jgi:hypothetical protein
MTFCEMDNTRHTLCVREAEIMSSLSMHLYVLWFALKSGHIPLLQDKRFDYVCA